MSSVTIEFVNDDVTMGWIFDQLPRWERRIFPDEPVTGPQLREFKRLWADKRFNVLIPWVLNPAIRSRHMAGMAYCWPERYGRYTYQTIGGFWIWPGFRGRGIATLLMQEIVDFAEQSGQRTLVMTAANNEAMNYLCYSFMEKGHFQHQFTSPVKTTYRGKRVPYIEYSGAKQR